MGSLLTACRQPGELARMIAEPIMAARLGLHYDAWRRWHSALAIAALGLALAHIGGVGHYVAVPWKRALWTGIGLSWLGVIA